MWLNLVTTLIQYTSGPLSLFHISDEGTLMQLSSAGPFVQLHVALLAMCESRVEDVLNPYYISDPGRVCGTWLSIYTNARWPSEACRRPRGTCFIPGSYHLTNKVGWPMYETSLSPRPPSLGVGNACTAIANTLHVFKHHNHLGTILWTFKINICLLIS